MAIEVAKVELKTVQDASGLEACIKRRPVHRRSGHRRHRQDRGQWRRQRFHPHSRRPGVSPRAAEARHALRSTRSRKSRWSGPAAATASSRRMRRCLRATTRPARHRKSRLAIGTAMSAELLPEDIGRPAMVQKVADAVKAAMRDAGIDDPADVHYVQTKTPLLTIESVQRRANRAARRRLRGAQFDGRLERHHRARHRGRARRDRHAEGRGDLPQSRSLFVGRVVLVGRRTDAGADRAARQQSRRRRPLSHRPFGDEGRARHRRHLRLHPQCRPRSAGAAARRGSQAAASSTAS